LRIVPAFGSAIRSTTVRSEPAIEDQAANVDPVTRRQRPQIKIGHYRMAIEINPNHAEDAEALRNLRRWTSGLGRKDRAVARLKEALRRKPDYAEAKQLLRALDAPGSG
jgi:hypothetical protein